MATITNSTNNSIITITALNVDFTVGGAVLLYTPPTGFKFFVTYAGQYYTTLTGNSVNGVLRFGTNASTYSNVLGTSNNTGNIATVPLPYGLFGATAAVVTPSAPLYYNIATPATATVAVGNVFVSGFLLPG